MQLLRQNVAASRDLFTGSIDASIQPIFVECFSR